MADGSPVTKLTDMILLSAVRQRATTVRIEPEPAVVFVIGDTEHVELRPPPELHPNLVRRLSIMAELPQYPRGGSAEGMLQLAIGAERTAMFSLRVSGHGAGLRAILVRVAPEDLVPRERL